MADVTGFWTNELLLKGFLGSIVADIYDRASEIDVIREAAVDDNPNRLKDRLVELQIGVLEHMFSLIDGSRRLEERPGIKLVNSETGESLTDDLKWELSKAEGEYLASVDPPLVEE